MKNILEGLRVQVAHRRRLLVGRRLGRAWLIAWIVIAAALVGRSLWSSGPPAKHVADAAPHSGAAWNNSSRLAKPDQSPSHYQFRAIEELRVGDRVVSDNPDVASPVETAVNPQTWRLLRLYAEERWPDGTLDTIHVETLQSPEWIEAHGADVGAKVPPPLDLLEMGLSEELRATVVANEPCPQLDAGSGRLVLTTVNHLNADIWELAAVNASGVQEQLRPTGFHRFYSDTRRDWVSTKEIHDNEIIRGRAGPLTIVDKKQLPGVERVYNLTVEGEHVYYASNLGLLTHNTCPAIASRSELPILNPSFDLDPTEVVGSQNAYSVAFRTTLPPTAYPGRSRGFHFQQANRQLIEAMDADSVFSGQMESLIPGLRDQLVKPRSLSRESPAGWTWHHHDDTGVMELVPRVQHESAGKLQQLLHPNGGGGMKKWGR